MSSPASEYTQIAICGIGLRLPGGICNTREYWELLVNGRDAKSRRVDKERFNPEGFDKSLGGNLSIRHQNGYFLKQDLGLFDPSFFSVSRKEAERCDPQQRLLLEVTRECLEDAGVLDYRGRPIGCYIGSFGSTWLRLQNLDPQFPTNYLMTGMEDYMLSNRISYEYDLAGPSMTINTACSASLVALHQACSALQNGTIEGAVVGGGCLQLSPVLTEMMAAEGTLSADGSCKSFDAKANGFARAEGITAIYIKRLDDAIRDGNPIRSIIRGCGTNSDGSRAGLMQPQARTQEVLMRQVYAEAGLDPAETAFVECHGTGTSVGDPIETKAIDNMFGQHGVYIGSVKPNIGHCEGSAGLASLIKAVLSLEHGLIPPNIKLETPNPNIPLGKRLMVPMAPVPYPPHKKQRVSINSFGIGGSNAHVVIDSFLVSTEEGPSHDLKPPFLVLFSANTKYSLQQQVELHTTFANQHPMHLPDMAYTRALRRERLPHRAFAIFNREGQVVTASDTLKTPGRAKTPKVAMVFSGQGSQWAGMGKELVSASLEFRKDLAAMDYILQSLKEPPDWSLVDLLSSAYDSTDSSYTERFNSAELSQPLCTALQIALVHHLRRLGITPAAVVGHSSGEIAAAYTAGHISLQAAIQAAYYRGLITKRAKDVGGGMAAVGLGAEDVSQYLIEGVVVACENSPLSSTISGNRGLVEKVLASVKSERPDAFTRMLKVDMAYHSHHMSALGADYLNLLRRHVPSSDDSYLDRGALFISSVTGTKVDAATVDSPEYWVRNLVQRVRFASAIQAMHATLGSHDLVLLEIGPHSTLGGPLRQIHNATEPLKYIATQKRGADCLMAMLEALGQLYQYDVAVDFRPLFKNGKALPGLPPYPWDHTGPSFWYESRISRAARFRKYPRHCLLGLRSLDSSDTQPVWRNILDVEELPWLLDHKVSGSTVFPFAGYIAVAGEAIRQVNALALGSGYRLRHVVATTALILGKRPVELVTSLRQGRLTDTDKSTWYHFQIQSHDGENWTEHCSGEVMPITAPAVSQPRKKSVVLPRRVSSKTFYRAMSRNGLHYGPEFALLQDITASATEQVAQASLSALSDDSQRMLFTLHPAELDSCLQLIFVAATQGLCRRLNQLYVPTLVEYIDIYGGRGGKGDHMMAQAMMKKGDYSSCHIDGLGPTGQPIFSLRGAHLAPLENDEETDTAQVDRHGLARLEWHPAFDFVDVAKFLQPPPLNRQHLELEQQLTFLCMLEETDKIRKVSPSQPHLLKLQDWINVEITNALETGAFPLVDNPRRLAQLKPAERQSLISQHLTTLSNGPHAPFAQACKRVCENGSAIFAGEVETIDVLTQEDLLTQVYNHNSFEYGQVVRLLSNSIPNLRILEVGAGTGGTTEPILRHLTRGGADDASLPSYSLYTFTDVSAGFFAKAKDRFSGYGSNMEYRVFDASKPPSGQGFEDREHSYDLIIAANVVHATPFIGQTLSNIRALLKPGGTLLLTEPLPTLKTVNYIFGHFSGWWLGDADGRHGEPLIGLERWEHELKTSGFSGADSVVYGAEDPYRQIMTIVSRAEMENDGVGKPDKRVTLLCADSLASSGVGATLQAHLEHRGWLVQACELNNNSPLPSPGFLISCVDLESGAFDTKYFDDETKFVALRSYLSRLVDKTTLWLMPPVQTGSVQEVHAAQFLGISRSLRSELNLQLSTLEISREDVIQHPQLVVDVIDKIRSEDVDARNTLAPDMEYAVRHSQILVPRFRPLTFAGEIKRLSSEATPEDGRASRSELRIRKRGLLNTFYWQQQPVSDHIPEGHIEVEVHAIGLNAFDLYSAQGIIQSDVASENLRFGCEASGVVRRTGTGVADFQTGDRVMFFTNGGGFTTHAVVSREFAVRIPDSMAYEQAATVPVCFGTVLHSLITIARVERGQTVLIHSACGGVGLAAIQVCQMLGAKLFLTVGSERKAQYLVDTFGFSRERIFSSRDSSFVDGVMRETEGVGVDVVLNSLSGELLHESWKCVSQFGCMVELGSRDSRGAGRLDMMPFGHNRSYHGVEGLQFTQRPAVLRRLCEMFLNHFREGVLRAIEPLTLFPANDVEKAFRFLEDASHIGKVALTMASAPHRLSASPHIRRIKFDPTGSYLLTGGVGGLGRAIATWMVEHGARHLTFLSRTSGVSDTSKALFDELEAMGCSTIAVAGHVDKKEDVEAAVKKSKLPIRGVLHLAMVLRDVSLMDMTWTEWKDVIAPKVQGAWNLHSALSKQEQALDFFFLASSIISVVEATGQANYLAANAVNEAFCRYRRSLGLKASVLNICPIDDVGFVAENENAAQSLQAQGLQGSSEQEFLQCLELALLQSQAPLPASDVNGFSALTPWISPNQYVMGLHTGQDLNDPKCRTMWRRDRRMGFYHNVTSKPSAAAAASKRDELQEFLASLTEKTAVDVLRSEATIDLFASEIGNKIFEYLLKPNERVDPQSTLSQMGLDSLLSVELARWFQSAFGVRMGVLEIVGSGTLRRLALVTARKLLQKHRRATTNGHQ